MGVAPRQQKRQEKLKALSCLHSTDEPQTVCKKRGAIHPLGLVGPEGTYGGQNQWRSLIENATVVLNRRAAWLLICPSNSRAGRPADESGSF